MTRVEPIESNRPPESEPSSTPSQTAAGYLGTFRPGQVLAERFVITEFLGSGGMGTVYEATDRVLEEQVAIKVIHPRIAANEDARLRLRREVQMARKITHPNICRFFDLFRHSGDDGLDLDLISMELLSGETLRQAMEREGAMEVDPALHLARQMASGLYAAHRLNIVHRDLKPSNVMLVQENDGLRVAITDFGLARFHCQMAEDPALTVTGEMVGTPAYMSPEQVRGDPISAASDIYSLGLILYEMLTGTLPFYGKNGLQVALNRLTRPPQPLLGIRPDVDRELAELIHHCLEVDPAQRLDGTLRILEFLELRNSSSNAFDRSAWRGSGVHEPAPSGASSRAVMDAGGVDPSASASAEPRPSPKVWRWALGAILCVAITGAVVGFLGRGPVPDAASVETTTVESPEVTVQPSVAPLETRVADVLEGQLRDMNTAVGSTVATVSADTESLRLAEDHLAVFDAVAAHRVLEEALEQHAEDPFLLARQAEALWRLGRDAEALAIAGRAVDRFGGVGAAQSLPIDALYFGLRGKWAKGLESLESSLVSLTDSVEASERRHELALWTVEATWLLGRNDPMEDLFAGLRQASEDPQDPRIDLWESRIAHGQGDYAAQERLARAVVDATQGPESRFLRFAGRMELAEALGRQGRLDEAAQQVDDIKASAARLQVPIYLAHGARVEGTLLKRQGQSAAAVAKLAEASALYEGLGALWGVCFTHKLLGNSSTAQLLRNPKPDLDLGIRGSEKGVAFCRRGGFQELEALVQFNLGRARRDRGEFDAAVALFQESSRQLGQLGNRRHQAVTRLGLALLLGRLGRTDEMLDALATSETWQRQFSDDEKLGRILGARAWGLIAAGQVASAKGTLAEAQELAVSPSRRLDLLELEGEVAWAEADQASLERAAKELMALASYLDRREPKAVAERLTVKALLLDGRLEEGLRRLEDLATPRAALLQAETLWDLGRIEAAAAVLAAAREDIGTLEERFKDWRVEILDLLLAAEGPGDRQRSIEGLQRIEHASVRKGHLHAAMRARLARGLLQGDREMLRAVEAQCRRHGFLRLAEAARSGRGAGAT